MQLPLGDMKLPRSSYLKAMIYGHLLLKIMLEQKKSKDLKILMSMKVRLMGRSQKRDKSLSKVNLSSLLICIGLSRMQSMNRLPSPFTILSLTALLIQFLLFNVMFVRYSCVDKYQFSSQCCIVLYCMSILNLFILILMGI